MKERGKHISSPYRVPPGRGSPGPGVFAAPEVPVLHIGLLESRLTGASTLGRAATVAPSARTGCVSPYCPQSTRRRLGETARAVGILMPHWPCPLAGGFRSPRNQVIKVIPSRPLAVARRAVVCAVPCAVAVPSCAVRGAVPVWCLVLVRCCARCRAPCGALCWCGAVSGVGCRAVPYAAARVRGGVGSTGGCQTQ